jgi:hypothetical protein
MEKAYRYALQTIARRDGVGSPKSVPVLQHLVTVSKQQNNLSQAIDFQKTVFAFTKNARVPDIELQAKAQTGLGVLYLQKQDYAAAEPMLKESVDTYEANPGLPKSHSNEARRSYARLLRETNREAEAQSVEARIEPDAPVQTAVTAKPAAIVKPAGTGPKSSLTATSKTNSAIKQVQTKTIPPATTTSTEPTPPTAASSAPMATTPQNEITASEPPAANPAELGANPPATENVPPTGMSPNSAEAAGPSAPNSAEAAATSGSVSPPAVSGAVPVPPDSVSTTSAAPTPPAAEAVPAAPPPAETTPSSSAQPAPQAGDGSTPAQEPAPSAQMSAPPETQDSSVPLKHEDTADKPAN